MIKFTLDLEKNELVLEMEPPYQGTDQYKTTVCIRVAGSAGFATANANARY